MKILSALVLSLALAVTAHAEGVATKVCHDKLDKAGKPVVKKGVVVQDCKVIKVHKKLDGATVVPVKK
jgi:hypothetical protein